MTPSAMAMQMGTIWVMAKTKSNFVDSRIFWWAANWQSIKEITVTIMIDLLFVGFPMVASSVDCGTDVFI